MTTSQERRRAPRVHERIACSIGEGGRAIRSQTRNLSTAGAYCLIDEFIAPMTKLQLDLELPPTGQPGEQHQRPVRIRCEGVVVRIEPVVESAEQGRYHMAVFFSQMSERDRAAIVRFVQARLASHPSSPP